MPGARTVISLLAAAVLSALPAAGALPGHPPGTTPDSPTDAPAGSPARDRESTGGRAARGDTRARAQQESWRRRFGTAHYRYLEDREHRLVFATCLDEESHADMQRMLAAQADQQAATLFDSVPEVEVFVAVARPADARAVIGGSQTTEGMYEHPLRRLVASDIGIVLRHEFTHVMHFGHMERLGQPHPLWIQEGLATLYENYALAPDGAITFEPNMRHNQARQMANTRSYTPLTKLVALSSDEFMSRSQQLYPQVRSLFEYMADTGKLRRWYRRYTETFAQDRTGRLALEEVFGKTLPELEKEWRAWVLQRPAVQMAGATDTRRVGLELAGATDGVLVRQVARHSPAANAGVRTGDVITAVNGQSVRSTREFRTAIGAVHGKRVTLVVRRGQQRVDLTLELPQIRAAGPNHPYGPGVTDVVSPSAGDRPGTDGYFLHLGHFASDC